MISLEFTGCIEEDAAVMRDASNSPCGIEFVVSVTRYDNTNPKHRRITHTRIHCTKTGCCPADARFVRGQKVYIRGDVGIGKGGSLESKIWQFELL